MEADGTWKFQIRGKVPSLDEVYELALSYGITIDTSSTLPLGSILHANTVEDVVGSLSRYFAEDLKKSVKIAYVEDENELSMSHDEIVLPVISKNSGYLGAFVMSGEFDLSQALGILALYDSFVSIVEGLVLTYRLGELFRSGLDALFRALNKRVRLSDEELDRMESIALEIAQLEGIARERCEIALKTANIGLIGVEDEIFSKIRSGDDSWQVYEEYLKHTDTGFEILQKFEVDDEVLNVCLYHHEFIDGSGRKGLKDVEIPRLALIMGLAEHVVITKWGFQRLVGKYPAAWLETLRNQLGE